MAKAESGRIGHAEPRWQRFGRAAGKQANALCRAGAGPLGCCATAAAALAAQLTKQARGAALLLGGGALPLSVPRPEQGALQRASCLSVLQVGTRPCTLVWTCDHWDVCWSLATTPRCLTALFPVAASRLRNAPRLHLALPDISAGEGLHLCSDCSPAVPNSGSGGSTVCAPGRCLTTHQTLPAAVACQQPGRSQWVPQQEEDVFSASHRTWVLCRTCSSIAPAIQQHPRRAQNALHLRVVDVLRDPALHKLRALVVPVVHLDSREQSGIPEFSAERPLPALAVWRIGRQWAARRSPKGAARPLLTQR